MQVQVPTRYTQQQSDPAEWFESYSHGAGCIDCASMTDKTRARFAKIENALYEMFYRNGAPHKAHVCCSNYVTHKLRVHLGTENTEKISSAIRESMSKFGLSQIASVYLYHEASRYVILRRFDAYADETDQRLARLEALEARVAALESEVEFLRGLDNARHVDMLHASKKRMYEADKKI